VQNFFINKEWGRSQAGKGKTGRGNLFPMTEMILEGRPLFLFVKKDFPNGTGVVRNGSYQIDNTFLSAYT
uniref:hypothetical protein n=1 Tax=Dialister invisus TaxID=218538 RepID=UPI003A94AE5C